MEKTLYPNRYPSVWKIALGLFCLWGGATFSFEGPGLRALAFIGGVFSLMPGIGWLKLTQFGFTYRGFLGEKTYRWQDVATFLVVTQRIMGFVPVSRKVGWTFSDSFKKSAVLKITRVMIAFDALLPDTYGLKAAELAALLETCRQQALAGQSIV